MTEEHRNVVLAEDAVPFEELLEGVFGHAFVTYRHGTVGGSIAAEVGVAYKVAAVFVDEYGVVGSELEVLEEADFEIAVGIDGVAACKVGVVEHVAHTVHTRISAHRTCQTGGGVCITEVIDCHAVVVAHDIAVGITHVHREDRADCRSGCKGVGNRAAAAVAAHTAAHIVGVRRCRTCLEPRFALRRPVKRL